MRATSQRTAVRPCREGVTASAHRVASNLAILVDRCVRVTPEIFIARGMPAAAALCAAGLPLNARVQEAFAATAAPGLRRLGKPEPFDYAKLKGTARQLSTAAFQPRPDALPPAIKALDWDRWQSIHFRNE